MIQPLAYMAYTYVPDTKQLAIFGGLSENMATQELEVKNEILYLNLETEKWQKPATVFAERKEDVPDPRMSAMMTQYGDKLYIYAGANLYLQQPIIYSDFFSFNMISGLWKKEVAY